MTGYRWTWADELLWTLVSLECVLKSPSAAGRAVFFLLPAVVEARRQARDKR